MFQVGTHRGLAMESHEQPSLTDHACVLLMIQRTTITIIYRPVVTSITLIQVRGNRNILHILHTPRIGTAPHIQSVIPLFA